MNNKSRTDNTVLNFLMNCFYQFFIIIASFFTRRIFIENLGVGFLGISGLFTNILDIFSLAELGIGSAISFSMYKEIANNNIAKLQALTTYYKKLYNRIALIITVCGLLLLPFLKYIVNLDSSFDNINIYYYYFIYLFNSVISYLFVYKTSIVSADQRQYRLKFISCIVEVVKVILQISAIVILKNFLAYLLVQVLMTLIGNIIRSYMSERLYPFIKQTGTLERTEKDDIWKNIKSMFFYKIGGVVMNSTDNILISILINTNMVGIYSNYMMIYNKIETIISLVFDSITASLGNLNATTSGECQYQMHKVLDMMSFLLYTFSCVGIFFLGEDVITAISGTKEFILDKSILIISLLNYYISGVIKPNYLYRMTTGLFKVAKKSMLSCAILNIILSIILGNIMGLSGIILSTIISRLLTNVWYEPFILYKKFFQKNPKEYFMNKIVEAIFGIGVILFMLPIMSLIEVNNLYIGIMIKLIMCCTIVPLLMYIFYRKNDEFIYIKKKIFEIFNKIFNKLRKQN